MSDTAINPSGAAWRRTLLEAGILALVAAALRGWAIGNRGLWLDEANTVLIAWKDPVGIARALGLDGNPPLFYWLLHYWMLIFGSSEAAVRALPALFGALGVAAVFAASRALFPSRPRIAWIAGAIACVSPLHVYYSQECRMYTLTPLLGILAFLSIHDFLQSGRTRSLFLHSLFLAAGLYTHNYFLFLLPVGSVIAWVTPGGMGRKRALLCAAGAAGAALIVYAPWIPVLFRQSRSGVDAWIPEIWRKTPPAAALFRSLEVMGIGGAYPLYLRQLAAPRETIPLGPVWPLLRFAGFILAVGLPLRRFPRGPPESARARGGDPPRRLLGSRPPSSDPRLLHHQAGLPRRTLRDGRIHGLRDSRGRRDRLRCFVPPRRGPGVPGGRHPRSGRPEPRSAWRRVSSRQSPRTRRMPPHG